MKVSKYVSIFEDERIVYNALNNGLAKLNPDIFAIFRDEQIKENVVNQYPEEIKELKKCMFLLDEDFDELQYIKFLNTSGKFQSKSLGLTIAPTLDCNFMCYYCIQDVSLKKEDCEMTIETADEILKFIEANHKKNNLRSLVITWYGGEPLLRIDIIKYLSGKIKAFCLDNDIVYHSSIITNGYLLNYEYAKFLSDHNVRMVQVTIDGPEEIHNKRRRHKDNLETYKVIIENIKNVANLFENILIRFNIDKTNVKYLDDLVNQISEEFDGFANVTLYVAPVVSDTLSNCNFSNTLYTIEEYAKIKQKNSIMLPNTLYPRVSYGICGATHANSFVVKPDGNLCKCWNEISLNGTEIGNLKGNITNISRFAKWINFDPTEIEKCKKCEVLPICMGGTCPHNVIFPNRKDSVAECNEYKYLLKEYILAWLRTKDDKKKVGAAN